MAGDAAKAREAAFELDPGERIELAEELTSSVEKAEPGTEEAWGEEAASRLAELKSGRVEGIPWSEFEAELLADEQRGQG